jgi:hypothetical protein
MVRERARRDAQFFEHGEYSTDGPRLVVRHVLSVLIAQKGLLCGSMCYIFSATAHPVNTRMSVQRPLATVITRGTV